MKLLILPFSPLYTKGCGKCSTSATNEKISFPTIYWCIPKVVKILVHDSKILRFTTPPTRSPFWPKLNMYNYDLIHLNCSFFQPQTVLKICLINWYQLLCPQLHYIYTFKLKVSFLMWFMTPFIACYTHVTPMLHPCYTQKLFILASIFLLFTKN